MPHLEIKNNVPIRFKQDCHVLMLIDRSVGNSNKGSKRWINKIITFNEVEFNIAVENLLALQNHLSDPGIRLYCSLNSRKLKSAILSFKHTIIDIPESYEQKFYGKLNDRFCSALMQPANRDSSLFLLDADTKDVRLIDGFFSNNTNIEIIYSYETPNGHHYIVNPFNPNIQFPKEITLIKDGLVLLNWIEKD